VRWLFFFSFSADPCICLAVGSALRTLRFVLGAAGGKQINNNKNVRVRTTYFIKSQNKTPFFVEFFNSPCRETPKNVMKYLSKKKRLGFFAKKFSPLGMICVNSFCLFCTSLPKTQLKNRSTKKHTDLLFCWRAGTDVRRFIVICFPCRPSFRPLRGACLVFSFKI
jgi:hypothetical protein